MKVAFNEFQEVINLVKKAEDYTIKLRDLHFDIFESPLFDAYGVLLDKWLKLGFNEAQVDTINWWLYEDVDKLIYSAEDRNEILADVTVLEGLWDYLKTLE